MHREQLPSVVPLWLCAIGFLFIALTGCQREHSSETEVEASLTDIGDVPLTDATECSNTAPAIKVALGDLARAGGSEAAAKLARHRLSNEVACNGNAQTFTVHWSEQVGGFFNERRYQYSRKDRHLIYSISTSGLSSGSTIPPEQNVYSDVSDDFVHTKNF
jgi:hypothetical protein